MAPKTQRIRDPLHNLIEFNTDQFEQVLWRVVQTHPFQRLRRISQLGFSELVYPGATHSRFAHSVGAFEIARRLMRIINRHIRSQGNQPRDHQMNVALAAALVHDVGHGMFSHAFEEIGKRLKLKMADHEHVGASLIRNGPIRDAFSELGSGFANDVADVISRGRPGNLYDAVVSSQFDADRLDYMQRDRLMTGVQNSGIDFVWLLNNLEVGEVPLGVDDEPSGSISTFVLGPKAIHAAETYVLSLFQLYPTVYYHKATRGAEKLFTEIMMRLFTLVRENSVQHTALPANHPIVRFAQDPEKIEHALALDDTVFWGALPMLMEAKDKVINKFSAQLWMRKLPKCFDITQEILANLEDGNVTERGSIDKNVVKRVTVSVREWIEESFPVSKEKCPRFMFDSTERHPYRRFQDSKGPLNQISIRRESGGEIFDMAEISPVISGLEPFSRFRVYYDENDKEGLDLITNAVKEMVKREKDGKHFS